MMLNPEKDYKLFKHTEKKCELMATIIQSRLSYFKGLSPHEHLIPDYFNKKCDWLNLHKISKMGSKENIEFVAIFFIDATLTKRVGAIFDEQGNISNYWIIGIDDQFPKMSLSTINVKDNNFTFKIIHDNSLIEVATKPSVHYGSKSINQYFDIILPENYFEWTNDDLMMLKLILE